MIKFKHALFAGLIYIVLGQASALTPTPEQIAQFKKLSPEEQQRLAQSMGVDVNQARKSAAPPAATSIPNPEVVTPREVKAASSAEEGGKESIEKNVSKSTKADKKKLEDTPQKKVIGKALKQFGYDLFAGAPSTFAPATHIPVPVDYVVGPGDTLVIQLYGKENSTSEVEIDREGMLDFPGVGPMSVNGLNFNELKANIQQTVQEKMIGVQASVTLGALRSIQVFVLGEAYRPGAYTVSALSTMMNTLFVSGGVTTVGSLRNIQLKRKGEVVSNLDLYDLLLRGDTSQDIRVQPGDVLFIPPIGQTAGISGEVRRPAIYELKNEKTTNELIALAGGMLPTAYPKASRIDRINEKGDRTFVDVNLIEAKGKASLLRDGDVLQIYSVLDKVEDAVLLAGHVNRPGGFSWKPGLRVSDVVPNVADLLPNPDLGFAVIKRELGAKRLIQTIKVDLGSALTNKKGKADLELRARDELIIFGLDENRAGSLKELVSIIKSQTAVGEYSSIVRVTGNVKFAGEYPLVTGMTVRDLIALAAGLKPETELDYAVLAYRKDRSGALDIANLNLNTARDLNKLLKADDDLIVLSQNEDRQALLQNITAHLVEQTSKKQDQVIVRISGAVRFPGDYPAISGLKASQLIKMAGGLKDNAFSLEAEVTRPKILFNKEKKKEEYAIDHFVVNLAALSSNDVTLKARDELVIKRIPNWKSDAKVEITGEVLFPGTYPVRNGERLSEVIKRSGGFTRFADVKAAVFLRKSLREREEEMLKNFRARLKSDVARLEAKSAANASTDQISKAQAAGAQILEKMDTVQSSGRLVISLEDILDKKKNVEDIVLKEGDKLVVPPLQQEISILGEVNHPTSYMYSKKYSGLEYLKKSGGATRFGDKKQSYVVRRDGSVDPLSRRIFIFRVSAKIQPGDTIIVPIDSDIISPLTYWTSISQVLFQLATTAAALKTVGGI